MTHNTHVMKVCFVFDFNEFQKLSLFAHFYPRPVSAFGYCRWLHLCVRVFMRPSVSVCINHEHVRTITYHPFKLGSPNLDQRCKKPWFRFPLLWGLIDLDHHGQANLTWKLQFTTFWVCPCDFPKISKDGPKVHHSIVKIPINFGRDHWPWSSTSFLISKHHFF